MCAHVLVYLLAPDTEERADNLEFDSANVTSHDFAHADQISGAGSAKQIDQECLDQIIRVMAEKNCPATPVARDIGEEAIARLAARGLDRHFRLGGESANID